MKATAKNWAESILTNKERPGLPIMTYVGLELTGQSVLDVVTDGRKQARCIEALAEKYKDAAAFVTIMDLSVEAEAFGAEVKFSADETPTVIGRLIQSRPDAEAFQVPEIGAGRTKVYLEAARLANDAIDRPVIGCQIGPFSVAGRLCDMTQIFASLMEEPDMVHLVLEKCTDFLIEYAKAFKATGCQGVVIAEPAAGLISPRQCDKFSSRYIKRIVDAVQDDDFMVMLHNCGNTVKQIPTLLSTGAKALHLGNAVDMGDILPQVPPDILACGNLDPVTIFKLGTPAEIEAGTIELLERFEKYPNFVISSGCDIPPGTATASIDAFFSALSRYNDHRCGR